MALVRVDVPFRRQPNGDYCVPTCIWMVNEYLRKKYGEKEIRKLSVKKIAKQILTKLGGGTEFKNISLINKIYTSKKYRITFNPQSPRSWSDIIEENKNQKPLIAWIWLSNDEGTRGVGHSVVICDIDKSRGDIYYNDPAKKPMRREDIASFISKWENENVNCAIITVEVEKRKQTQIPEYSKEEAS